MEDSANSESSGLSEVETKVMESLTAGIPTDGTPAYFDWASNHYAIVPDNVARAEFLENLIGENLDWIGLDRNKGNVKVLDYGAGTGILSQAFVPHVSQVLAIDNSRGMVDQYNKIAAANKNIHPGCDMRAVKGDLIDRYNLRQALDADITDPDGDYQSFDLVVMCLAIDCFITDAPSAVQSMELINALDVLAGRLKHDGVLVIVDIEKFYDYTKSDSEPLLDGRKETGSGSREVIAALNEIGMEDIAVIENQDFKVELELFGQRRSRHEKYFMVRARKGEEEEEEEDCSMKICCRLGQENGSEFHH